MVMATPSTVSSIQKAALDGPIAALALGDGRVVIVDLEERGAARELGRGPRIMRAIALSHDWVAVSGGWDPALRLFSRSGSEERVLQGPDGRSFAVAFSGGGRWVGLAGGMKLPSPPGESDLDEGPAIGPAELYVWDLQQPGAPARFQGDGTQITCLAGHPDGPAFVAGFSSGAVVELPGGREVTRFEAPVEAVAFSADGLSVVAVSEGGLRRVSLAQRDDVVSAGDLPAQVAGVRVEEDDHIALAGYDRNVLLQMPAAQVVSERPNPSHHPSRIAACLGGAFVVVGGDGVIRAWSLDSGDPSWEYAVPSSGPDPRAPAR